MFTFGHSRVESPLRTRTLGLLSALAVATTTYATAPPPAAASPLTYSFSGEAGGVTTSGIHVGVDTFDGFFMFDPTILPFQPYTDVDISVSGPIGPGVYRDASTTMDPGLGIRLTQGSQFPAFDFEFNRSLDVPGQTVFGVMEGVYEIALTPNGVLEDVLFPEPAIFISVVPEPASLALLGSAFGLFLFALRLNRRAHRA